MSLGYKLQPFDFGDTLAGNIKAVETESICPDEGALYISREDGCVVLADGRVQLEAFLRNCDPERVT